MHTQTVGKQTKQQSLAYDIPLIFSVTRYPETYSSIALPLLFFGATTANHGTFPAKELDGVTHKYIGSEGPTADEGNAASRQASRRFAGRVQVNTRFCSSILHSSKRRTSTRSNPNSRSVSGPPQQFHGVIFCAWWRSHWNRAGVHWRGTCGTVSG